MLNQVGGADVSLKICGDAAEPRFAIMMQYAAAVQCCAVLFNMLLSRCDVQYGAELV